MAEPAKKNDAHVVEIPVLGDGASPVGGVFLDKAAAAEVETRHQPLGAIASSEGHLLLLKLWQREESRLSHRACALEVLMDAARWDTFYLCVASVALHCSLALLFTASVAARPCPPTRSCRRWWVPSSLSLATSLALAAAMQLRVCPYWRTERRLWREHGDVRALARCVQELRMKGRSV